jgi:hypothetical protein
MEAPRQVFANACESIASKLVANGFRYAKSGPHCARKSEDFTFQILFSSSFRNVAGSLVKLWISGTVYSKRIKRWRADFPLLHGADYVAGGQIGNLTDRVVFNDWNLADPVTRDAVIADAHLLIDEIVLPYFLQFEDMNALIARVVSSDVPSFTIDKVVDFLVCYADADTARKAATNFLDRRPVLVSNYQRDFNRYAERGLDWRTPSGYASQLALASHLFGFGDLTVN